jgi:myosin heavy subunit
VDTLTLVLANLLLSSNLLIKNSYKYIEVAADRLLYLGSRTLGAISFGGNLASSFSAFLACQNKITDFSDIEKQSTNTIMKKGAFQTFAQRHKEQLTSLMNQLYTTEPDFVRFFIPNEEKKPQKLDICRAGFPNRFVSAEFGQRYELLASRSAPPGFIKGRKACQLILESLALDANQFRVRNSKVFFRTGVVCYQIFNN